MKSSKRSYLFLLFLFWAFCTNAQQYLFPVKPGQRTFLSGNFSEIRPNHFHSGIDVKIGGVDGEPILAISDGYISRIKVSTYGYGNVLYLMHHNGESSVYAHLRNFSPRIEEFMRKEMYFAKKNELEVFPDPEFLPIKRGEVIGFGGNTGSSGGPHLHFEIRDSLDRAVDPFRFGFKEVVDNTPPVLYRVAFRPLDLDSRVNGKYQRIEITPILEAGTYVIKEPVKISGKVGLEVYAIDRMDAVGNVFGLPTYELLVDNQPHFKVHLEHVDFNTGRFFLTHMHQNKFIRLYRHPNNPLQIYTPNEEGAGAIHALDKQKKEIRVNMKDFFGNARTLKLTVLGENAPYQIGSSSPSPNRTTQVSFDREVMMIQTAYSELGTLAKFFVKSYEVEMAPAYMDNGRRTYLWDMNFGVPDSIDLCTEIIRPSVLAKIPFAEELSFANKDLEINFEKNTLLDDLFLRVEQKSYGNQRSLKINSPVEYLQSNMTVLWRNPTFSGDKTFTHVYMLADNGRKSFVGGSWESGDIRFKTRNFGTFVLDEDKVAPVITPIRVNASELRFTIKDDKSGIKDFEAMVNGQWVLMRYEHKQQVIWSEKLDKQAFKGEVVLKVRDMAGNESTYRTRIP